MSKQLIIVGGPNGSGKTTFVHSVLQDRQHEYLGAEAMGQFLAEAEAELK